MAISWDIKIELVNEDSRLTKIIAIRTDGEGAQSFFVKARMKTKEERDKVWADIWNQYLSRASQLTKEDPVALEGKTDLENREVP